MNIKNLNRSVEWSINFNCEHKRTSAAYFLCLANSVFFRIESTLGNYGKANKAEWCRWKMSECIVDFYGLRTSSFQLNQQQYFD